MQSDNYNSKIKLEKIENHASVEMAVNQLMPKFNSLDEHIESLYLQEMNIREQLRKNCQDLKIEVDQLEERQRKIKQCLSNVDLDK